ncbi:MAG: AIG2-like domain protein, partial [uncultured Quadrisphaera sp.]
GSVRRLREQPAPGPDGQARPALPAAGHRLGAGLAAHLRRGGARLGRGAGHARRGRRLPGLRGPVRPALHRRGPARRVGGPRHRPARQGAAEGRDPGRRAGGLGVRARRLRGRAAQRLLPGDAGLGGRGRGGARRLRGRAALAAPPRLERPARRGPL